MATPPRHVSKKCARATCKRWAIVGGTVCATHGGKIPRILAKARVRGELETWKLWDTTDDPGETLLRLITQSRRRADAFAEVLDNLVERADGDINNALVADVMVANPVTGEMHKTGEYFKVIAQQESVERDRLAKFCMLAIGAGLAERVVRMKEQEAAAAHAALVAGLNDAGITGDLRQQVLLGAAKHLRLISAESVVLDDELLLESSVSDV